MSAARILSITVDLPSEAFHFHRFEPQELAAELRTLWLLDLVRQRRLGHGKAAELAGIPRAAFLRLMARHQVSAFDFDEDELTAELAG